MRRIVAKIVRCASLKKSSVSIVPIRHAPPAVADVNAHNDALARAIQGDGRVYLSSALIDGEVWLRPCFGNFRILDVARDLGERLLGTAA